MVKGHFCSQAWKQNAEERCRKITEFVVFYSGLDASKPEHPPIKRPRNKENFVRIDGIRETYQ